MRYRWLLLLSLALALVSTTDRAGGQAPASLSLDPPAQTVFLEDGPFDVRLLVDDVTHQQGLGGYTLVLAYDPAIGRGLSVTDSGFVESTGNIVICPDTAIDHGAGRLAHACFTIPVLPEDGPRTSDPQLLATVRLEPIAEGATQLDIGESEIFLPDGRGLQVTTSDGRVTVQRRGGPAPPGQGGIAATASPTADGDSGALPRVGSGGNGGSNLWLYVGLGTGGALLLALLGGGWELFRRRRRRGAAA